MSTRVAVTPSKNTKPRPESRKAKVTDENRAEAKRLKAIWQQYKDTEQDGGRAVTQQGFALANGLNSQSLFTQYINGHIPLNLQTAVKFAKGLRCRLEDFSPRLAREQAALAPGGKMAGPKTALQSVLELDQLEQQLLGLYRELEPGQKDDVLQLANRLHAEKHTHASPANPYGEKPRGRQKASQH